jgi:hypothetical protein
MKIMTTPDFTATVVVDQTPNEAFDAIANVSAWWAKSFKGHAKNVNDTFSVTFTETFVNFEIIEAIPAKKAVWLVTDCNLHWLTNKKEWEGTQVVWDIARVGNTTEIVMTHEGLVPESECYDDCSVGWTGHIKSSLYKLLSEGIGQPE